MREFLAPHRGKIERDLRDKEQARAEIRDLANQAVALERIKTGTKEAAIGNLSARHDLGSWLLRLCRGDPVRVEVHYVVRLVDALAGALKEHDMRLALARERLHAIGAA
ncbi:hypothetical protein [Rhodobium gokarnense]|uniref:Uncharacterized protein n=1 Tax=Rhodobium gokarnense TaxID=364296 RepID=A0ABT3HHB3_9HYPH|nr:hypothetical protein [Rhodobium gokarnense]MCW2309694.1 hypothetical protein [Rhodobium gokarnense]